MTDSISLGYTTRSADQPWSFTVPDAATLRFEVRDQDYAAIDAGKYTPSERSDLVFASSYGLNTAVNVNFNLSLELGVANSASFVVLGQFVGNMADGTTSNSPPFDIDLTGDQLIAYARYTDASGNVITKTIYVANAALVRGQSYNIDVKAIFDPSGNGRIVLSIDGAVVADYQGPLGFVGQQSVSWGEGINRSATATETLAADFKGTSFKTGSDVTFPDPVSFLSAPTLLIKSVVYSDVQANIFTASMFGYALGRATVSLFADGVLVGTTTAAVNGYYSIDVNVNGQGKHYLTASSSYSGGLTSISSIPATFVIGGPSDPAAATPANFIMAMNGRTFWVQNAAHPWSITAPDANTLRFEVRDNDVFVWDQQQGLGSERSEMRDEANIQDGTPIDISYNFQVEPGLPNDATYLIVGQLHQQDAVGGLPWSPPFEIGFTGEKMTINVRYTGADGLPVMQTVYTDVNDFVRGRYYSMEIKVVFDASGQNARLVVLRDGSTLVDYSGPLGYVGQGGVYWKEGVYRSHSGSVTQAADYQNLSIVTGSAVTFPDKSLFIAAPAITSSSLSVSAGSSGLRTVAIAGTAKLGTQVLITENGITLASGTVDSTGAYSVLLNLDTTVRHTLQTYAVDALGHQGLTSVIEVDTAAGIMSRLAALKTRPGLVAMIATDTNVLPLPASLPVGTAVSVYTSTLAKLQGSYSFLRTTVVTGQSYDKVTELYSAAGVLVERRRLSGSNLVYLQSIASDGSQTVSTYSSSGAVSINFSDKTGRVYESDQLTAGGILFGKTLFNADGSRLVSTFNQTTGVQTGYTAFSPSGARQVATLNIVNQAYTKQILSYDATNKLVAQERFTATDIKIFSYLWFSDGTSALHNYSAATGSETSAKFYAVDGTYAVKTYQITNQVYTSQTIFFTAANKTVGTDNFDGTGVLLTSVRTNSDGSTTTFAVATGGVVTGYTQTFIDGSQKIAVYAAGLPSQLAKVSLFNATGNLVWTDVYGNGGDILTTYDVVSTLATGTTQTLFDGTVIVSRYAVGLPGQLASVTTTSPTGVLLESDLYDSSGKLLSTDVYGAAGHLLTSFDAVSGFPLGSTLSKADGTVVTTVYATGVSGQFVSVKTLGPTGAPIEVDLYDGLGKLASTRVFSVLGDLFTTFDGSGNAVTSTQSYTDGSSIVTSYQAGSPGLVASISTFDAVGRLLSTNVFSSGGSLLTSFNPLSGLKMGTTQTGINGTIIVTVYAVGIPGQLASVKTYSGPTLVETDLYDGSGKLVSTDVFSGGGDVLTSFDPVSGLATSARQTTADGSYKVTAFAAGSSAQIASVKSYTASNILIETDLFDATGKLASTDVFSGGSDLLTLFDANGRALTATLTNADGSRVVTSFQPGSAGLIASVLSYAASGGLVETDLYNSAGKKISARLAMADGSSVLTSFNAATGLPVTSTQTMIDGSTSLTTFQSGAALIASVRMFSPTKVLIESDTFNASGVRTQATIYNADRTRTIVDYGVANLPHAQQSATYAPSGTLVSMTRWYGDAASTVAFTQTVNPDGSSEVHNYDTAGRETVRQILAADGSKDASVMTYADATTPTPSSVVQTHFGPGNQKQWTDTTAADGSHKQVALAANATLTTHANVADTFTSVAAGGDIFVFKPAFGQDIVTNFHAGAGANHDTIDLTALHLQSTPGQSSLAVLGQALQQSGRDAVITITPTDTITLKNTLVANLTREDFRV